MFSYACPFCRQRLLAAPARAGQRTICPKCLRPLVIPHPDDGNPNDVVDLDGDGSFMDPPRYGAPAPAAAALPPPPDTPLPGYHPAPRPLSVPAARRGTGLSRSESGMVNFHPTGLAAVDIGAELSAALTLRMKPPPDPPADLNLSTGGWLALTALAIAAWVGGVVYEPGLLPFVALVGVLMVTFAYFWAVYLAGQRNWVRGAVTLLPPVAAWRMCLPFGENGYRPLRFALTGLTAVGLYFVGPAAHAGVKTAIAAIDFARPDTAPTAVVATADRLKASAKQPDGGVNFLIDLAGAEYRAAVPDDDRAAVVAEVKRLSTPAGSDRPDVRAQAVRTLCAWSPTDARPAVLAALQSADAAERRTGMNLAVRWADRDIAHAVAARLGNRSEEGAAREVLAQMDPAAAEAALLKLLANDDVMLVLSATELLEKVGGPASVKALDALARTTGEPAVRDEAKRAAEAIRKRAAK